MTQRYTFANQLRGAAALCVVIAHLTNVYWGGRQLVANATFSTIQTGPLPGFTWVAGGAWYNLGPFGVALFFLISGFVIPISLERQSVSGFLVARVLRIYPTYVTAFAIGLAVIACNAWYWHKPIVFDAKSIVANALLLTDFANVPSVDLVNWTLTVELRFYLVMAILAVPVRRGNLFALYAVALLIVFVTIFSHHIFLLIPASGHLLQIFESNALYLLFMLIGVVFSFHVRGRINATAAVASVIILFAFFVVSWPLTFFRGEYPHATLNYGWAVLVFSLLYALRRNIGNSRVVDFFAAISYPLYLVHSLVGFSIITFLMVAGHFNALVATSAAFVTVVAIAAVLHIIVERPSQRYGKRLAESVQVRGEIACTVNAD